MSNDDDSRRGLRRDSGLVTAPPPTEPLPAFDTAEMRAFDLAVALAKVSAADDGAPPSLLVPNTPAATSPPQLEAPTPVVRIGPSDIARLEQDALAQAGVSVADVQPPSPVPSETALDGTDFDDTDLDDTDAIFDAPFAVYVKTD